MHVLNFKVKFSYLVTEDTPRVLRLKYMENIITVKNLINVL